MKYDRIKHLTTLQLCTLMGVEATSLSGILRAGKGGPRSLFHGYVEGRTQSIYDKTHALAWIEENRKVEEERRIVPAAQLKPISQQGEYRPSPAMRLNLARASEVYPHRFVTPKGTGNYREFGNLGRGEA